MLRYKFWIDISILALVAMGTVWSCRFASRLFLPLVATLGFAVLQLGLPISAAAAPIAIKSGFVQVAAGGHHTCAIAEIDGGVYCWGQNHYGQLGQDPGVLTESTVAVPMGLLGVKALAAGDLYTCAILADNTVACWGANMYAQLGNGGLVSTHIPTPISDSIDGPISAKSITAGSGHACALTDLGSVYCWGYNNQAQTGVGHLTLAPISTPHFVNHLGKNVRSVKAGHYHTCALGAERYVRCWGNNKFGQLGNNDANPIFGIPTNVWALQNVALIDVGAAHSCAVLLSGEVLCWGFNNDGDQTVNVDLPSTFTRIPREVLDLPGGAVAISAGAMRTCAVLAQGTLKCWGHNNRGQLGDGTVTALGNGLYAARPNPVTIDTQFFAVRQVSTGWGHTCVLTELGGIVCWGSTTGCNYIDNTSAVDQCGYDERNLYSGKLGDGRLNYQPNIPADNVLVNLPQTIISGAFQTCAIAATPTNPRALKCWGRGEFGQLGVGSKAAFHSPQDVFFSGDPNAHVLDAALGEHHACAIIPGGIVKCWGYNLYKQVGDGTQTEAVLAPRTAQIIHPASAIAARGLHTCAIVQASLMGQVMCWGHNQSGEIGVIGYGPQEPTLIPNFAGVTKIAAGYFHNCAIANAGNIYCWGRNGAGELGNGTFSNTHMPTMVPGLADARAIGAGDQHTCAVVGATGSVWCWGRNSSGQLGDGTANDSPVPVRVLGLRFSAVSVSAGANHTCATSAFGELACWGDGAFGKLGTGATVDRLRPFHITFPGRVVPSSVSAGRYHTCAISLANQQAKCWGLNAFGQLGDGHTTAYRARHEFVLRHP